MSTIRLEHEKFNAAPMLAKLQMTGCCRSARPGETAGEMKSTTLCAVPPLRRRSAASAAVARGRAARAGRMMIIEEDAAAFAVTEALGESSSVWPSGCGARRRRAYGRSFRDAVVGRAVACGDQVSRDLLALPAVARQMSPSSSTGRPVPAEVLARFIHNIPNAPRHRLSP